MSLAIPGKYQKTVDLLANSLSPLSVEPAPTIPADLLIDLTASPTHAIQAAPSRTAWFSKLFGFAASPGFGLAAAAALTLAFVAPALQSPKPTSDTFRGVSVPHQESQAALILITSDLTVPELLEESQLFDMEQVIVTSDPLVAVQVATAKLLVDVQGGSIVGYSAESREILADQLPADPARIPETIATAFAALH